ncbi:MAG: HNH endonuclease [Methanomassiliicoccales archaeon]
MPGSSTRCVHRLTDDAVSYCFLQSSRFLNDGSRQLVFHGAVDDWPIRCDASLARSCTFRHERVEEKNGGRMVPCPCCGRKHREGSTAGAICVAWHGFKAASKELRESLSSGRRFYPDGTTTLPYSIDTPDLVRRLLWPRIKASVLRRDAYICQDCGEVFGHPRRKSFDPSARKGRGGHRWESLEVHHIVPRYRMGSDHPGNLKTLCPDCHAKYTQAQLPDFVGAAKRQKETIRMLRKTPDEPDLPWDASGD